MPFTNPDFKNLLEATNTFSTTYAVARKTADANRFFGSLRSGTINPERAHGAQWISNLANHIDKHAKSYGKYDARYLMGGSLFLEKNALLRDALAGALFLQLRKIDHEYDSAYRVSKLFTQLKNSVLAGMILPLFQIDSFMDIPADTLKTSLVALQQYLNTMKEKTRLTTSHPLNEADVEAALAELRDLLQLTPSPREEEQKQPAPAM